MGVLKSFFLVVAFLFACHLMCQAQDTLQPHIPPNLDSTKEILDSSLVPDTASQYVPVADSIIHPSGSTASHLGIGWALKNNKWINTSAQPVFFVSNEKSFTGKELFFYVLCGLLLLLGIFKTVYGQYFSNIFRVYFNTSLRQSQLSEQLLQARLPSFLLNILFIIVTGIFVWLLFWNRETEHIPRPFMLLQICIAAVAGVYLIKFCFLKFVGWISGISAVTDYYIFIIFLVNKILTLVLLPYIILLAFGKPEWFSTVETLALLSVGALLVSRYVKSYALAGHRVSVKPLHFLIFIAGAEIIPILLIYKLAVDYFVML